MLPYCVEKVKHKQLENASSTNTGHVISIRYLVGQIKGAVTHGICKATLKQCKVLKEISQSHPGSELVQRLEGGYCHPIREFTASTFSDVFLPAVFLSS